MFADVSTVNDTVLRYVHEGVWTGALALGGFIVMFPLRWAAKQIKDRFAVLDAVKIELETQRTNHLSHIQMATENQTKVLEAQTRVLDKMSVTLEDMRGDQRELLGHIKNNR